MATSSGPRFNSAFANWSWRCARRNVSSPDRASSSSRKYSETAGIELELSLSVPNTVPGVSQLAISKWVRSKVFWVYGSSWKNMACRSSVVVVPGVSSVPRTVVSVKSSPPEVASSPEEICTVVGWSVVIVVVAVPEPSSPVVVVSAPVKEFHTLFNRFTVSSRRGLCPFAKHTAVLWVLHGYMLEPTFLQTTLNVVQILNVSQNFCIYI